MKQRKKAKPQTLFEAAEPQVLKPFYTHLRLNRGGLSFDSYPFNIPAIQTLDRLPLHPKLTFFIGENGSGKSTLLEAIAVNCRLNPEGGSSNFNFNTRASHSGLSSSIALEPSPPNRRITDSYFLRAESFFNVATEIERLDDDDSDAPKIINSYGKKSLHEQSHGESFFALMDIRFRGDGFYLLDEPEAALSPSRQMSMLAILHRHISDGSQFIVATHSPILMAYPDALIYSFDKTGIRQIAYEDTENFRITRDFLNRRQQMLDILLADDA